MRKGFTLIELVAVLVLVSLTAVFAGHLVSVGVGNYLLGVEASDRSQERVVAQQRLIREINWAQPGSLEQPDGTSLRWVSRHPERLGEGPQTLTLSGGNLVLNGNLLLPEVSTFSTGLGDGSVQLSVDGWNSTIYVRLDP